MSMRGRYLYQQFQIAESSQNLLFQVDYDYFLTMLKSLP